MWKIAKQFDFCYGHRVWSQTLNPEFSLDSCLKCRHLHGHQGTLNVFLEADHLQDGMVTDFKHLNWLKKWLDDVLDHKFIMDANDPAFPLFFPGLRNNLITVDIDGKNFYQIPDPKILEYLVSPMNEIYEGLVFVNFVPTSENLSKWIFDIVQEKMSKINVKVSGVQFFETPKSQSNYIL